MKLTLISRFDQHYAAQAKVMFSSFHKHAIQPVECVAITLHAHATEAIEYVLGSGKHPGWEWLIDRRLREDWLVKS